MRRDEVDYKKGVETDWYIKKAKKNIDGLEELHIDDYFDVQHKYLAVCNDDKNFFSSVDTREEIDDFQRIGGT